MGGTYRKYASHQCYLNHRRATKKTKCDYGHDLITKMVKGKERSHCRVCNTARHRARAMGVDFLEVIVHWPPPELCECCGIEAATHFDHDHSTNEFRGWLCNSCNTGLGMFKDNLDILKKAYRYLKKSRLMGVED